MGGGMACDISQSGGWYWIIMGGEGRQGVG